MNLFETISAEISGQNAYELTDKITQYYRSPGSSGYHAATNTARNRLIEAGLQVEETHYPLDGKTVVLDRTMPMAWEPYDARVRLISPVQEEIVNFDRAASCLAWWSCPTPEAGIEAELVDVGTGEREEDYAGKDLAGKIAFVHNADWHVTWSAVSEAIALRGAKGIITDFFLYPTPPVRTREKVPNAVQLLRLEFNAAKKFDFWACSVDCPTGQKIKTWLRLGPVKVQAAIKCSTFVGYGQNILATIPGASLPEESVFVLAHSSTGSRPGANCASGTSLLVETARTLNALISQGALARPRRSIKFLLVSEGLGSYNYLNAHPDELKRVKASYCLESVGHNQRKLNTTLYYSCAPDSTPSFINDHFEAVLERVPKQWGWVGRNEADISPIVVSSVPYTPWSDNSTWAAHGIPSALFMSWPDEYFHSQLLTAEVTDPAVFAYVGAMVAAAAYEVANAGLAEALWLAQWVFAKSVARLYYENQQALWQPQQAQADEWTKNRLEYLCFRDSKALASLSGLVGASDLPALDAKIKLLQQRLSSVKGTMLSSVLQKKSAIAKPGSGPGISLDSIPRKNKQISTPGLAGLDYLEALDLCHALEKQDAHFVDYVLKPATDEMWNLIKEVRNIEEIIEYTMLQFNLRITPESWLPVFAGWQKAGLIAI
jgi:hypothetical protein